MTAPPEILLLDDGELSCVAGVLDEMELPYRRVRGAEIEETLPPPRDLLITTSRHVHAVRRGSPANGRSGRPIRIIAVHEDSTAMRRMLREMNFHLLVRLPSQSSIWRLLIHRAIYQGSERRIDTRVAVGSAVAVGADQPSDQVVLMDISNRGCRLLSRSALEMGATLKLALPERTTGGLPLELSGQLTRCHEELGEDGRPCHTAAMVFNERMSESDRTQLGTIINRWSMGPGSIIQPQEATPSLPPQLSTAIPGLMLDEETDPAIRVGETVAIHVAAGADKREETGSAADLDRRSHSRGVYSGPVLAMEGPSRRVLMGRDLSAGGMRVESMTDLAVGDRFRIAIYGPSQEEPFLLDAVVIRDEGEAGLGLAFENVPEDVAEALEKLVACLPDVESLEDDEVCGLGAVISEILDDC
jgi:hypothetical protein